MMPQTQQASLSHRPPARQQTSGLSYTPSRALPQTGLVHLDFEDLQPFEQVKDQYGDLGIQFEGAIALQPSNPAFLPCSGSLVLMPTARRSGILIHCHGAIRYIGAAVRCYHSVVLTALDEMGNIQSQTSTAPMSFMSDVHLPEAPLPRQRLELRGSYNRVLFHSSAPFTLDDLFFGC